MAHFKEVYERYLRTPDEVLLVKWLETYGRITRDDARRAGIADLDQTIEKLYVQGITVEEFIFPDTMMVKINGRTKRVVNKGEKTAFRFKLH